MGTDDVQGTTVSLIQSLGPKCSQKPERRRLPRQLSFHCSFLIGISARAALPLSEDTTIIQVWSSEEAWKGMMDSTSLPPSVSMLIAFRILPLLRWDIIFFLPAVHRHHHLLSPWARELMKRVRELPTFPRSQPFVQNIYSHFIWLVMPVQCSHILHILQSHILNFLPGISSWIRHPHSKLQLCW